MDWYQMLVLAIVQGITEFLPISSSAHLILVPHFLGWTDQGLGFDLAMHLGTLVAVIVYFRRDVTRLLTAWIQSMVAGRRDGDVAMAWGLVLATIPAVIAGLAIGLMGEDMLRAPGIIATTSIVFGLLLGLADARPRRDREPTDLGWREYLGIGLLQAVALIPGSSRSGMTILGGRAFGLSRPAAARVSFFMAIPITVAAIAFEIVLLLDAQTATPWGQMGVAAVLACVSAMIAIHYFLRMLQSMSMMVFVVYRLLLGILLFAIFGWSG
ncbi:undecaprenyl-diphosphate phosphatase [Salinisphaera sp. T31B1]|uniref:undecaprenyl-diphosphate phosphatase n=1 Tax=Salinisphaera sp. T31B1 TaxID=727963 RepID=UPI0033426409